MYLGQADEKTTELCTHVSKANPEAARVLGNAFFGDLLPTVAKSGQSPKLHRTHDFPAHYGELKLKKTLAGVCSPAIIAVRGGAVW